MTDKKLLSLLLAVVMLMSFPIVSQASYNEASELFGGSYDSSVSLRNTLTGYSSSLRRWQYGSVEEGQYGSVEEHQYHPGSIRDNQYNIPKHSSSVTEPTTVPPAPAPAAPTEAQTEAVTSQKKSEAKIKASNVTVKKNAKNAVIKVKLTISGKAKKNKKVIIKLNGKKYVAKTNKKGVASIKLKKSVLKKLKKGKKYTYTISYGKKTIKKKLIVK